MFAFLRFPSGLAAHLHLSWLDPHKERRFTVVGAKRMATFDDMAAEHKLTIYDKGFDEREAVTATYIAARRRDPLAAGRRHRAAASRVRALRGVHSRAARAAHGRRAGVRVVRVLEALQRELDASRRSAALGR